MAERRQVPRYLCDLKGEVVVPVLGSVSTLTVYTLSVTGCRTEGSVTLNAGQKCELKIDADAGEFRAAAQLMWKDRKGHAGWRFLPIDDKNMTALKDICASLRLQPLAPLPGAPE